VSAAVIDSGDLPERVKARVVVNPAAAGGRDQARSLREAIGVLAERGWNVEWTTTTHVGHAEQIARSASEEGATVVVVAGGDGTVNEAVNGLAGSATALAVLPAGTGNVLAAQLGMVGTPTPLHRPNPPEAAMALSQARVATVDTAIAHCPELERKRFLMWAGIGLDAAVAHEVEGPARNLKRALGPMAFGVVGLKTVLRAGGVESSIQMDDSRLRDRLLLGVVANIPLYAGTVELTPGARIDDGLLDLALFTGDGLRSGVGHIGAVLSGLAQSDEERSPKRARSVRVVSDKPLPVHLDAEPYGSTPISIEVDPASLRLLVPPTAPERLFQHRTSGEVA
jgi:YegS/Rv2252/BmrU family lipid kinase